MTDWERVEKLRSRGRDWEDISQDSRVAFQAPQGADAGRALKTLYLKRRSTNKGRPHGNPTSQTTVPAGGFPRFSLTRGRIVMLAIVVAFLLVVAYMLVQPPGGNGAPTGWVGRSAPNFTLPIANGPGSFTLSQERGQKNVLLFFNEGLSCAPCLTQMQQLDSNVADFTALNVLVVSITGDSQSDMTTWASNSHVTATIVLADPSLGVCNLYQTTGAAVSMMPGSAPGHTFILVNTTGFVVWRADYGPSDMSIPLPEILQNVRSSLSSST